MFIGIVEVNERRYCCGVWEKLEDVAASIDHPVTVTTEQAPDTHLSVGAASIHYVELQAARERNFEEPWYGDCDGFFLYEYQDAFPGFVGYDED